MALVTFRGGHASLRFDADPDALAAYLENLIDRQRLDVLTTTESRNPKLVKALRHRLGPQWRVIRRQEYLHVWNSQVFTGRPQWAHLLVASPIRYWMMGKLGRRFLVGTQRLFHRPTRRLCRFSTGHAPSGVEGRGGQWRIGALLNRIPAARDGFHAWGRRVRRWQRRHPGAVQVLSLDGNLDQRFESWRDYFQRELGGESLWVTQRPKHGTHGHRVIDDVRVIGGRILSSRVDTTTPLPPGIDHRPVVYVAQL